MSSADLGHVDVRCYRVHADFGGLSSLDALVVVRLVVVPLPPLSPSTQTVAGWSVWADILLDVIGGGSSALRDSAAGGMSEDHDRCFSTLVLGAFSIGVFNTNALPRINIGADVWGESSIMTGVY